MLSFVTGKQHHQPCIFTLTDSKTGEKAYSDNSGLGPAIADEQEPSRTIVSLQQQQLPSLTFTDSRMP